MLLGHPVEFGVEPFRHLLRGREIIVIDGIHPRREVRQTAPKKLEVGHSRLDRASLQQFQHKRKIGCAQCDWQLRIEARNGIAG